MSEDMEALYEASFTLIGKQTKKETLTYCKIFTWNILTIIMKNVNIKI